MNFRYYPWRFGFRASDPVHFPAGKAGNVLRGTFGQILLQMTDGDEYCRLFAPRLADGPSGLADPPRPFVFRAAHLDGRTVKLGEEFWFDVHVFETRGNVLPYFVLAFAQVARKGIGTGRGKASMTTVWQGRMPLYDGVRARLGGLPPPVSVPLDASTEAVSGLRVTFETPTELKAGGIAEKPEFGVLYSRARDRVCTLAALYGDGPVELDFRALGEQAQRVRMVRCEIQQVDAERTSQRTGETHPLGGFVGVAEYEGELQPFLPVLRAAQYTGVGRQTVWGKGAIRVEVSR